MARPAKINSLQFGEIRQRPKPKHSQAHPGVSPLNPVSHRNTTFQPLRQTVDLSAGGSVRIKHKFER